MLRTVYATGISSLSTVFSTHFPCIPRRHSAADGPVLSVALLLSLPEKATPPGADFFCTSHAAKSSARVNKKALETRCPRIIVKNCVLNLSISANLGKFARKRNIFFLELKKNNLWGRIKTPVKVAVTAGALYWVSTNIHFRELKEPLERCNPVYLVVALMCYATSQVLASSRLRSFLTAIGLRVSERYNLRLYQVGLLYNFFLPGGIGGDGYKIYFLKKNHAIRGRRVLTAVFFDRLSGLWALSVIICCLVMFMPRFRIPNMLVIAVLMVGTATYIYVLWRFFRDFFARFIITHVKALAVQGLQTCGAVLILLALNHDGKFSPYLLVFLCTSLVAIIPSVLGGLGLRESLMGFGAAHFGLDIRLAILLSLVFYLISLLVASSGAYYILRPQRLGVDRLPSTAEAERELGEEK